MADDDELFTVTVIDSDQPPRAVVLFAVGRGGSPARHIPLLTAVAQFGCTIVAPHFPMLHSLAPTKTELEMRLRRLELSAHEYCRSDIPVVGIGHSIGTVLLLVLAGAEARTRTGEQLISAAALKIDRLALMAPPTDFFRKPGSLSSVRVPIRLWVGARDSITPPDQAQFLKDAIQLNAPIEICIDEEADHFSYMDELPPKVTDSHPNRGPFLASVAKDVGQFAIS